MKTSPKGLCRLIDKPRMSENRRTIKRRTHAHVSRTDRLRAVCTVTILATRNVLRNTSSTPRTRSAASVRRSLVYIFQGNMGRFRLGGNLSGSSCSTNPKAVSPFFRRLRPFVSEQDMPFVAAGSHLAFDCHVPSQRIYHQHENTPTSHTAGSAKRVLLNVPEILQLWCMIQ